MAFTLPDLPYAHDALAGSGMSKETLEFHHDIHHKAYVDNGNKLIAGTEWEGKSRRGHRQRHLQEGCGGAVGHLQQCQPALEPLQFWQMMSAEGGGDAVRGWRRR